MTIKAGILSDTHLIRPDSRFKRLVSHCFGDCSVIIHAGDLTDLSVLEPFKEKVVYAVYGNMCTGTAKKSLAGEISFVLGGFTVGLTHGAHLGADIELRLWDVFPEADCVIYGHTHRPACHRSGGRLFINPGCFQQTGRYGAPGTYAILTVTDSLSAKIHEVPQR
ncbi:MAG: YfcE family phosphodiesterase [Desulfobulbus propionicus]|nr:MAG: YfcE family phosphodiesterase [Desulfobulbus propionicus]